MSDGNIFSVKAPESFAAWVFVQHYILAFSFDFPMTCWKTNKAESSMRDKSEGLWGDDRPRGSTEMSWPGGAGCLRGARGSDVDPGGVCSPRDLLHRGTLSLASAIILGKQNPRGEGQPLAPQKAMNDISQSGERLNWTRESASDRRYGRPLCNSTGVMSFRGSFIKDIIGFHRVSHLSELELISPRKDAPL